MEKKQQKINEEGVKLLPPKMFRRFDRTLKHGDQKHTNDRKKVGTNLHAIGLGKVWNPPFYSAKRKKIKGWQKENRRYRKVS